MNILVGIAAIVAVSGLGRLVLRVATGAVLPLHWYVAVSMLCGMGLAAAAVEICAEIGVSRLGLQVLGAAIGIAGLAGHFVARRGWSPLELPIKKSADVFVAGVLGIALVLSFLVSLAPSTKIDELNYHMLVGRRVVEDGGLRVYQLPIAQSIFPQMGYQVAQSVLYATGSPDSGNLLGLAFGTSLVLLVYGVVVEETGEPRVALLAAAACAVGLYPPVWHVTSGPHALGDLGTATAAGALFFPGSLREKIGDEGRAMVCVLASAMAAFTKISLMPLAILMSLAGLLLVHESRLRVAMLAVGIWLGVHSPLVLWTYWHTGSPLGAATAKLLHSTAFEPGVFSELAATKNVNQTGLLPMLRMALLSLNGGFLVLLLAGLWLCLKQWRKLALSLGLLAFQGLIIALYLPHDFRFLGGLQYTFVIAGAIAIAPLMHQYRRKVVLIGSVAILTVPWLAVEAYYVLPFAAVDAGLVSRAAFLDRYVAFMQDFRNLDGILPLRSDVYISNARAPSTYSPRPVIYSLADWDRRTRLFRFAVLPPGEATPSETEAGIACRGEVYRNNDAVVETYRTPGREPKRGVLVVQQCESGVQ